MTTQKKLKGQGYKRRHSSQSTEKDDCQNELFNRHLLETCPIGLALCRMDGTLVKVNVAFADIIGRTIEETLQLTYSQITPKKYAFQEQRQLESLEKTGRYDSYEKEFMHKNGHLVPVRLKGVLIEINGEKLIWSSVEDITDRQKLQEELIKQRDFNKTIIEACPAFIVTLSLDGKTQMMNPAMLNALGYNLKEVLGTNYVETFVPEADRVGIYENIESLLHTGQESFYVNHVLTKTGEERLVEWHTRFVKNETGEIEFGIAVGIDISDRKALEKELANKQALFDGFFSTATAGFLILDNELRYVLLNQAIADINGIPIVNHIGKKVKEVLPELAPTIEGIYEKILTTGEPYLNEEVRGETPQQAGVERHWMVSYFPLPGSDDKPLGLGGVVVEITDRKQAEAQLKKYQEQLEELVAERTVELTKTNQQLQDKIAEIEEAQGVLKQQAQIINQIHDAVICCDLNGIITSWNKGAERLYGYSALEAIGQEITFFYCRDELSRLQTDVVEPLFTKGSNEIEMKAVCKTGEVIYVHLSISLLHDKEENVTGMIGYSINITDRKQAEEILLKSEQTLRQKAMQEALINQLAGQIRNSLNLDTILATAVQEIHNLMQIDWCVFGWYRLNLESPIWEGMYEAKNPALPTLLASYPVDLENLMVQQILQMNVVRTDDLNLLEEPEMRLNYLSLGIHSSLAMPIQTQSGEIGVIGCNHSQLRPWKDEEVELLKAVADQLAIAIDQARLYEKTSIAAAQAQAQAQQLEKTLQQLQRTQTQLIQSEKMSSLGQLVAGVAHEINNPVNFIYGNLAPAEEYTQDLLRLLQLYEITYPNPTPEIQAKIEAIELDFLREDLPKILNSMKIGADRIREIVLSLRTFSRLDEAEMKAVNIHEGIDSTLLILQNRLKARTDHPPIQIIKEYGNLPVVECFPGQLNQVFMNIITNAVDALDEYNKRRSSSEINLNPSTITIRTTLTAGVWDGPIANDGTTTARNCSYGIEKLATDRQLSITNLPFIVIQIIDNGPGMKEEVKRRLFDPFFTTKPVGKGTGLGLAISYQIIVEKHHGILKCNSAPNQGAEFIIQIPIRQSNKTHN